MTEFTIKCNCRCHANQTTIIHPTPCCKTCPICKERVINYSQHLVACRSYEARKSLKKTAYSSAKIEGKV